MSRGWLLRRVFSRTTRLTYSRLVTSREFNIAKTTAEILVITESPSRPRCFARRVANVRHLPSRRWADLVRKMELWVEIHELNEQGEYAPVELQTQRDNETGGIFQLRQGHSRRIVVRTRVVPKSGSLPVVCNMISGVYAGSICCRNRTQRSLESYQEKDLSL